MAVEHPDPMHWERVATELRAAREAQQRTWGNLDNAVLGRYLADEATPAERVEVEVALEKLPDLKLLTDLVRDVLTETAPAAPPVPAVAARIPAPLPFRRPAAVLRKSPTVWRQRVAVLVAACLFLALGLWLFRPLTTTSDAPEGLMAKGDAVAMARRNHLEPEKEPPSVVFALAPLDEAVRQLDAPHTDTEKRLDAANRYWHVAEKHPDLERDPQVAPKLARAWNRVGEIYETEGDLDRAERALVKANDLSRKTFGDRHEVTRQTCCNLAGVYERVAVAPPRADEAGPLPPAPTAPPEMEERPVVYHVKAAKYAKEAREAGVEAFRERMNRPEAQQQMREHIVPTLAKALEVSPSCGERTRLAFALGNLGPLARDAAPELIKALQQAKDPQERFALIRALAHTGPPTEQAVPVLVQTLKDSETDAVRRSAALYLLQAPAGKKQLDELAAEGQADEKQLIREVLQRPRGGR